MYDLYVADAEAGRVLTRRNVAKKPSTLALNKSRIERHIKPPLGRMPVAVVDRADVERFLNDVGAGKTAAKAKTAKKRGLTRVTGGQTAATRAVGLPGAIYTTPCGDACARITRRTVSNGSLIGGATGG